MKLFLTKSMRIDRTGGNVRRAPEHKDCFILKSQPCYYCALRLNVFVNIEFH